MTDFDWTMLQTMAAALGAVLAVAFLTGPVDRWMRKRRQMKH